MIIIIGNSNLICPLVWTHFEVIFHILKPFGFSKTRSRWNGATSLGHWYLLLTLTLSIHTPNWHKQDPSQILLLFFVLMDRSKPFGWKPWKEWFLFTNFDWFSVAFKVSLMLSSLKLLMELNNDINFRYFFLFFPYREDYYIEVIWDQIQLIRQILNRLHDYYI